MRRVRHTRKQTGFMQKHPEMLHFAVVFTLALSLMLFGCGNANPYPPQGASIGSAGTTDASATGNPKQEDTRLTVITTLFPQYDFVRILAGDRVSVSLILPPGIEPHSFEPTPKDIVKIGQADLFIYTGGLMEPWAERILEGVQSQTISIVDTSTGIELLHGHAHEETTDNDTHANDTHAEEEEEGADPHIWLDPLRAAQMVQTIAEALIAADPNGEAQYRENAKTYIAELKAYDTACLEVFGNVDTHTIVYGGHFAFGYFSQRYGLDHVSPYTGFSPDAEPTPRRIAELIDRMKEIGSNTLFYEELVDPKVAEVISASTGAEMLLLHGAHNLSREELDSGATYLGIMRENLEKLKKGLGYHE